MRRAIDSRESQSRFATSDLMIFEVWRGRKLRVCRLISDDDNTHDNGSNCQGGEQTGPKPF